MAKKEKIKKVSSKYEIKDLSFLATDDNGLNREDVKVINFKVFDLYTVLTASNDVAYVAEIFLYKAQCDPFIRMFFTGIENVKKNECVTDGRFFIELLPSCKMRTRIDCDYYDMYGSIENCEFEFSEVLTDKTFRNKYGAIGNIKDDNTHLYENEKFFGFYRSRVVFGRSVYSETKKNRFYEEYEVVSVDKARKKYSVSIVGEEEILFYDNLPHLGGAVFTALMSGLEAMGYKKVEGENERGKK